MRHKGRGLTRRPISGADAAVGVATQSRARDVSSVRAAPWDASGSSSSGSCRANLTWLRGSERKSPPLGSVQNGECKMGFGARRRTARGPRLPANPCRCLQDPGPGGGIWAPRVPSTPAPAWVGSLHGSRGSRPSPGGHWGAGTLGRDLGGAR